MDPAGAVLAWDLLAGPGCLSGILAGLLGIGRSLVAVPGLIFVLPLLGISGKAGVAATGASQHGANRFIGPLSQQAMEASMAGRKAARVELTTEERQELTALSRAHPTPRKLTERAWIILLAADDVSLSVRPKTS
jgi:hypothetical protein